jgi:hypothetical protein
MSLRTLTGREASILACLTEAAVQPGDRLPAVRDTDAVAGFDRWLSHAPRLNRAGLRALLYAVELGPRLRPGGRRLRRLPPEARARAVTTLTTRAPVPMRLAADGLRTVAVLCYYGDDRVRSRLGYDSAAVVRRGRELRAAEGRP